MDGNTNYQADMTEEQMGELADAYYDFKEMGKNIETQDNRSTNFPFFCVFEYEEIVIPQEYSAGDSSEYQWVSSDGCDFISYCKDDVEWQAFENLSDDEDVITINGEEFRKLKIAKVKKFVTACFTEHGAKEYLKVNGHNLNEPFIYVTSTFRNEEMNKIRNHLVSM